MQQTAESLVDKFCNDTLIATSLLYRAGLRGQMLVLLYSSIDSMGLLDAPPAQVSATGGSFKAWAKKYILPNGDFEFNEIDLWAARCSVLHTFTAESDLSKSGSAKQIQYYSGQKDTPMAQAFVTATNEIDEGKHVPANIGDLYLAFSVGVKQFANELTKNCKSDQAYEQRLDKIIQPYHL